MFFKALEAKFFGVGRMEGENSDQTEDKNSAQVGGRVGEKEKKSLRGHLTSEEGDEIKPRIQQENDEEGGKEGQKGDAKSGKVFKKLFSGIGEGMQETKDGHGDRIACEHRDEQKDKFGSCWIGAGEKKENGRKAGADLDGGRNVKAEFFLDEDGQAHQGNFEDGKEGRSR